MQAIDRRNSIPALCNQRQQALVVAQFPPPARGAWCQDPLCCWLVGFLDGPGLAPDVAARQACRAGLIATPNVAAILAAAAWLGAIDWGGELLRLTARPEWTPDDDRHRDRVLHLIAGGRRSRVVF